MADNQTRRRFLLLTGTAATIGIAGCSTSASTPEDAGTTETQTATANHDESGGSHDDSGNSDESGHDEGGHDDEDSHSEDGSHDGDEETTVHEQEDEHGGHGHGDPVGDPVEHAEITMVTGDNGYHFEPHIVRVVPGGTVTFHNESGAHGTTTYHPDNGKQLRIPESAEPWDSGILSEQGASFEVTLDTEGVYDFYCEPHESLGMIGSIVVGEPDPHGQPGLNEPSSDMPEKIATKIGSLNERVNEALGHTH